MNTFHLDILAAEGSFFSGACESLIVTTPEGQRGILAHRANIITALVPGELIFRTPDGVSHWAAVSSGLIKVEDNSVLVLVDSAERPEDIDANRRRRPAPGRSCCKSAARWNTVWLRPIWPVP